MEVLEQIQRAGDTYTDAERRVADYCVQSYAKIAFLTLANLAAATRTSAPTVMRFTAKAGFDGFSDLQKQVRDLMESDWTRALDRLHRPLPEDESAWPTRCLQTDVRNLSRSYSNVSADTFEGIATLLANDERDLHLAGGEITHGLCLSFADLLRWLRDDVHLLGTVAARLPTELAALTARSVLFVCHLRRLTSLMESVIQAGCAADCSMIIVTNSPTLPLPDAVDHVVVVHLQGPGAVLDSYTAIASIMNGLAARVAELRHDRLHTRFDRFEQSWLALKTHVE